jgi:hypothetical protein
MNNTKAIKILLVFFAVVFCLGHVGLAEPIGTAFTYQGRLIDNNQPADGLYDFQFRMFDDETVGNQLGLDFNKPDTQVNDGYFTVELDFGNVFDGNAIWLEIGVRPGEQNDPNAYTTLIPRQKITPTPYAIYARNGSGAGGSLWQVSDSNIYYNAGNVGIGTTTPSSPLTIKTISGPEIEFASSGFNADIMANVAFKVGTTTSQPFYVITNNIYQMTVDSSGNVGIGTTNPSAKLDISGDINTIGPYKMNGDTILSWDSSKTNLFVGKGIGEYLTSGGNNVALGSDALHSNEDGCGNCAIGNSALYNNTSAYYNTAVGYQALYTNTEGRYNCAIGNSAIYSNLTGNSNSAIGDSALWYNTSGSGNVALGAAAMYRNTTGGDNVGVGSNALADNTTGARNTAMGWWALVNNVAGSYNTIIGGYSAYNATGGSNNTFLGYQTGYSTTGNSNVFLGYKAGYSQTGSNKLYIANSDVNNLIYGDFSNRRVGINTTNPGTYTLYVNGTAYATGGWTGSDLRFKQNIERIDSPIDKVMNIKGVSFEWKRSEYKDKGFPEGRHYGVVAQDVEQTLPEIVREGPDGEKAVSYTELVPILTEAIKEQQKQIESLRSEVKALKDALRQNQFTNMKEVQQ